MSDLLTLALAQGGSETGGVFRFFAALGIILCVYIAAWSFTYWISKDE